MSRAEETLAEERLVVCVGSRFQRQCAEVIDRLTWARSHDHYRFVMDDWMGDDCSEASVLWVVDDTVQVAGLVRWLAKEVPLLVPEGSPELKNFCVTARCGLYYDNSADAEACLHLLLANDALRQALGSNGKGYALLCELIG